MNCFKTLSVLLLAAAPATGQVVSVEGGATSVLLNFDALEAAAGLTLNGASPEVIAPGVLGPASVAFEINSPSGPPLQTDFSYDPADFLGTFSGTGIEHTGTITFSTTPDIGLIEVGNFTIGFDATRQVSLDPLDPSGFFVRSNGGFAGTDGEILFDIGGPTTLNPGEFALQIGANLLVSSEFAGILQGAGLASADLTGVDVGDAFVNAAIPEPGSALLAALATAGLVAGRRRR